MTFAVVEPWVEEPLQRFVDDARVLLALVLHPSGQVMGQHGFNRAVDVMSACALAAAIHASASALGEQLDGKPFAALHHAGANRQVFIAEARTQRGRFVFLTVFDRESSLGLVSLYFDEFRQALAKAAPAPSAEDRPVLAEHFERDLNLNLAVLFGRV
ncbi:MAG: hypothetical protein ACJ8AO_21120 [Gemmatimonadaceae bacterium]